MRVSVMDEDMGSRSESVGTAYIPVADLFRTGSLERSFPITQMNLKTDKQLGAFLKEAKDRQAREDEARGRSRPSVFNSQDHIDQYLKQDATPLDSARGANSVGEIFVKASLTSRVDLEPRFFDWILTQFDTDGSGAMDIDEYALPCPNPVPSPSPLSPSLHSPPSLLSFSSPFPLPSRPYLVLSLPFSPDTHILVAVLKAPFHL